MTMAILTLSREFRSGSREIAAAVAEALNYQYVAKERLLQDMKAAGDRWERVGRQLDEMAPSLWERYDWEYRGFVALVESKIYEYALQDNVIIVGRGGNHLLRSLPHVLKVRLTAAKDLRVERAMLKDGLDHKTASFLIDRLDRNRADYVHIHYGRNWDDRRDYDMVLNTGEQSYEQVTKILTDALGEKDRLATPEARKMLSDRALAARVRAGILTNRRFHLPTLEVSHDGQSIILQGVVHDAGEHRALEALATKIASPAKVLCRLRYRTR